MISGFELLRCRVSGNRSDGLQNTGTANPARVSKMTDRSLSTSDPETQARAATCPSVNALMYT